jgi:hypothetical protein
MDILPGLIRILWAIRRYLGIACASIKVGASMLVVTFSLNTVVLEIGLTNTHSHSLFWPHRQDVSADQ